MAMAASNVNNMGAWEVAGAGSGKRTTRRSAAASGSFIPAGNSTTSASAKAAQAKLLANAPKIKQMAPLHLEGTIYNLIADDLDDNPMPKPSPAVTRNAAARRNQQNPNTLSPKQKKVAAAPNLTEDAPPVNLLSSSMAQGLNQGGGQRAAQKSPNALGDKRARAEFENAVQGLSTEEFDKEHNYLISLFAQNQLLINQHMASHLNNRLSSLAEFDASVYSESELFTYPAAKLDKKLSKFLTTQIGKLNRPDQEKLFDYCFGELFTESAKVQSLHGIKIYMQLLVKQSPHLIVPTTLLPKYTQIIDENKHRHQRCLIALWALGLAGNYSLTNGIRVWFECILPQMSQIKNCATFAMTYLYNVYQLHKQLPSSADSLEARVAKLRSLAANRSQPALTVSQYVRLVEFVNDTMPTLKNVSRDVQSKMRATLQTTRTVFVELVLRTPQACVGQFESIFQHMATATSSIIETDLLEFAEASVVNDSKECLSKWEKIYPVYMSQTITLIDHLADRKQIRKVKSMDKLVHHMFEHTTQLIEQTEADKKEKEAGATTKETNSRFRRSNNNNSSKSAAHELEMNRKLNNSTKILIKQHFRRTSTMGFIFRTLFWFTLLSSIFLYWDQNQNKSIYTKQASNQLEKYGLLEQTNQLLGQAQKLGTSAQTAVKTHVPVYYKKTVDTVGPIYDQVSKTTKQYCTLAWKNSEPYRAKAYVYIVKGDAWVRKSYPGLVKNVVSCAELAVNYAQSVYKFVGHYAQVGTDYVGTQLLGWKKGQVEQVFLDAFKVFLSKLANLVQRINTFLTL